MPTLWRPFASASTLSLSVRSMLNAILPISSSSLPATGLNWALPTAALGALLIAAVLRRRRRT